MRDGGIRHGSAVVFPALINVQRPDLLPSLIGMVKSRPGRPEPETSRDCSIPYRLPPRGVDEPTAQLH